MLPALEKRNSIDAVPAMSATQAPWATCSTALSLRFFAMKLAMRGTVRTERKVKIQLTEPAMMVPMPTPAHEVSCGGVQGDRGTAGLAVTQEGDEVACLRGLGPRVGPRWQCRPSPAMDPRSPRRTRARPF